MNQDTVNSLNDSLCKDWSNYSNPLYTFGKSMLIQMLEKRHSDCCSNFVRLQEVIQGPDQEIRN